MKQIPLSQGKFALVDDEDYEYLNQWKWHLHKGYAARTVNFRKNSGERTAKTILMHRIVLSDNGDMHIDHIDRNKLNNQKSNLRYCKNIDNIKNKSLTIRNKSGFKGVAWHKRKGKWCAYYNINLKKNHLGYFDSALDAAKAYNETVMKHDPIYGYLNPI